MSVQRRVRRLAGAALAAVLASALFPAAALAIVTPDPTPPATHVKLVFIHHSTGQAWLADDHGHLGMALRDNGYFVSDTNYGWGPTVGGDAIGSHTDIGDWWTWFRGSETSTITSALFGESGQNCSYSRLGADPGGENTIVVFKSCFPNSELGGSPGDAIPLIGSNPMRGQSVGGDYTVANAKGIYRDLLEYFKTRPDKLFVLIVSPPMTSIGTPPNARAMADWLVSPSGWLSGYTGANVAVFDYYNVLTSNGGTAATNDLGAAAGNHHRYRNGVVEDVHPVAYDDLAYPSDGGDSHPNAAGDLKATAEFVPLLNIAYNRWLVAGGGHPRTLVGLSRPALAPGRPAVGVGFNASGALASTHTTAGTVSVEIRRLVRGVWQPYATGTTSVAAGSATFVKRTRVGRAGTFRIRFVHACADHVPVSSSWWPFTTR